jgi:hypothetical protein
VKDIKFGEFDLLNVAVKSTFLPGIEKHRSIQASIAQAVCADRIRQTAWVRFTLPTLTESRGRGSWWQGMRRRREGYIRRKPSGLARTPIFPAMRTPL